MEPIKDKAVSMSKRYGTPTAIEMIEGWLVHARNHIKGEEDELIAYWEGVLSELMLININQKKESL